MKYRESVDSLFKNSPEDSIQKHIKIDCLDFKTSALKPHQKIIKKKGHFN